MSITTENLRVVYKLEATERNDICNMVTWYATATENRDLWLYTLYAYIESLITEANQNQKPHQIKTKRSV